MKSVRVLVIAVFVSLMVMGVGYAMWSQTITVNMGGTLGTLKVEITHAYVLDSNGDIVSNHEDASATITDEGKKVSLTANKLITDEIRKFNIVFKNVGDCPAVLNKIDINRESGDEVLDYILVSVDGGSWVKMDIDHSLTLSKSINPGDSISLSVQIMLDQDAENTAIEQPFALTMIPFFAQP